MTARVGCNWKTLRVEDLLDIHVDLTNKTAVNLNNNESIAINNDFLNYQYQTNLKKQMDVKVSALHTALLASDPNIRAIFHLHSPLLMAFSCLAPPFHELRCNIHPLACGFADKVIYYRGSSDLQGATGLLFLKKKKR
ncbi:hypothetical protein RFI_06019 [Reticulomyxa filosa]|uniref:Class II aldolase/adducin N-terminal domain-containing protein n=1 Tax=Reticulomyxa filosa TaxID=46433 RepID=X6NYM8_RETFI|nr:hypothetical protein RFI_06019 [Reticulomyxa filosa]|eukprot:ETO31101.1 hypothetical protein RFI_06019 [Reticulomyxa filosa]